MRRLVPMLVVGMVLVSIALAGRRGKGRPNKRIQKPEPDWEKICTQPPVTGKCRSGNKGTSGQTVSEAEQSNGANERKRRAAIPRWFFNSTSNSCEEFTFGGCEGKENNFVDKHKCMCRCAPQEQKDCNKNPGDGGSSDNNAGGNGGSSGNNAGGNAGKPGAGGNVGKPGAGGNVGKPDAGGNAGKDRRKCPPGRRSCRGSAGRRRKGGRAYRRKG